MAVDFSPPDRLMSGRLAIDAPGEEDDGLLSLFLETRSSFLQKHHAEFLASHPEVREALSLPQVVGRPACPESPGKGGRQDVRPGSQTPRPLLAGVQRECHQLPTEKRLARPVARPHAHTPRSAAGPTGLVWQMARTGIKASAIAAHAEAVVEAVLARAGELVVIKIGITQDVQTRHNEYLQDGFHAVHVLAETNGLAAGMLETLLISKFRSLSYGRCWNQHPGGEGIREGGVHVDLCWTYVAVKYVS